MKSNKTLIEENRFRKLYLVEEEFQNEQYKGYYVENKGSTKRRAQAYRWKTIKNGIENIEDNLALNKAKNTLIKGFSF